MQQDLEKVTLKDKSWEAIEKLYDFKCINAPSIFEHLPTLYKYALECDSVIELGTGPIQEPPNISHVSSIYSFLKAKIKWIRTYDISYHQDIELAIGLGKNIGLDIEFIKVNIPSWFALKDPFSSYPVIFKEKVDLLFIDTKHTGIQLYQELIRNHKNVNKYIIMHDTVTFGQPNSKHYIGDYGLINAINNFIMTCPKEWTIKEHFNNCHGLTIMERI